MSVYPGRLVVESGASLEREGDRERRAFGELALRYGIFESVELRLDAGSRVHVDDAGGPAAEGFADPALSVKIEIRDYSSGWIPESAIVAGQRFSIGDADVGAGRSRSSVVAALRWELSRRVSLITNAGVARPETPRGWITQGIVRAALAIAPRSRTSFFAELVALSEEESRDDASLRIGLGASRVVRDGVALDVRVERGSSGDDPDYALGAGISLRF